MFEWYQMSGFLNKQKSMVLAVVTVIFSVFLHSCGKSDTDGDAEVLKINGSTTVNLPIAEAAEELRSERGMVIAQNSQNVIFMKFMWGRTL